MTPSVLDKFKSENYHQTHRHHGFDNPPPPGQELRDARLPKLVVFDLDDTAGRDASTAHNRFIPSNLRAYGSTGWHSRTLHTARHRWLRRGFMERRR